MFTVKDIIESTKGEAVILSPKDLAESFSSASIDTRTINPSELFVPLKGKNSDGHEFLDNALKIAKGAIVDKSYIDKITINKYDSVSIISVNSTLDALQRIGSFIRQKQESLKVIGITGSSGKTTTKELAHSVLNEKYSVLKTSGNYNNHIGLPLCLTRLDNHDIAVMEMGASAVNDINTLCEIARPNIGIITNIGAAHLEGFGSINAVRDTKLELFDYADTLIVNGDDDFLMEGVLLKNKRLNNKKIITYGIKSKADITGQITNQDKNAEGFFSVLIKLPNKSELKVKLNIAGTFNVYNALAAASVGYIEDVQNAGIVDALERFKGVDMRMELKTLNGAKVLSDVYNANPSSVTAALDELIRIRKNRAIAVLGDMLELGKYSEDEHRKIGKYAALIGIDCFIGVGNNMKIAAQEFLKYRHNDDVYYAENPLQAKKKLLDILETSDTILIKGSRGIRMEEVLK
ncbi:UDP-N-acetylmuramoylalanyl-D-glutamyl-2,6-diaminopimelate--D-alanyl-D-alanyl ligase [Candidatus Magnetoovum chiemensis]|nr:UDP-N-acetylmuramoylalanyl-D-glutamyl-2,6-diaminopimelate--D-alanyl-D-alanyl ligase [Candidatus Magnetoovum chiemensis]